jgi:hypothetical protein
MPSRLRDTGSCSYYFDLDKRLVLILVEGDITGAHLAECVADLVRDPHWSDDLNVLWDERRISRLDVTPEDLDVMVDVQTQGQYGEDVILTVREEHEMVMQLYAWRVRASGRSAQVCTKVDCALDALGLSEKPQRLAA